MEACRAALSCTQDAGPGMAHNLLAAGRSSRRCMAAADMLRLLPGTGILLKASGSTMQQRNTRKKNATRLQVLDVAPPHLELAHHRLHVHLAGQSVAFVQVVAHGNGRPAGSSTALAVNSWQRPTEPTI